MVRLTSAVTNTDLILDETKIESMLECIDGGTRIFCSRKDYPSRESDSYDVTEDIDDICRVLNWEIKDGRG